MALGLPGPRREVKALTRFVAEIEARYITPHLQPTQIGQPSREEELDVAAFTVLAHGALENFVEGVASWILDKVVSNWTVKRRMSRGTASLLLREASAPEASGDARSVFDCVREALDSAKSTHSKAIYDNNGINREHLRALLLPLGVDVPTDPVLIGSLDSLVKMRHQWAHQFRHAAKSIKSASDAKQTVDDCLILAGKIADNALSLRP